MRTHKPSEKVLIFLFQFQLIQGVLQNEKTHRITRIGSQG